MFLDCFGFGAVSRFGARNLHSIDNLSNELRQKLPLANFVRKTCQHTFAKLSNRVTSFTASGCASAHRAKMAAYALGGLKPSARTNTRQNAKN